MKERQSEGEPASLAYRHTYIQTQTHNNLQLMHFTFATVHVIILKLFIYIDVRTINQRS